MKISAAFVGVVGAIALATGCYTTKNVDKADVEKLGEEGTIVFVRASRYTPFFGSHSPRDFFEVVYERFSLNDAGQPVVEVGIRYRGGTSFSNWQVKSPETITIGAKCNFYASPQAQSGGPIVYSTNNEPMTIRLGDTYAYRAVCPVKTVRGYQLVLGE